MNIFRVIALAFVVSAMSISTGNAGVSTPPALDLALQTATPGDIVDLGFSSLPISTVLNDYADQIPLTGGYLLYSDDPETAEEFGILYQDDFPAGSHRIYLYHVNGTNIPAKVSAVFENLGAAQADVTIGQHAFPTPSVNYFSVGREALRQYYEDAVPTVAVIIEPGERATLQDFFSVELPSTHNQLTHVIQDFISDQPLRVSSVMVSSDADTAAISPTLPFAANDEYGRQGTFESNTYENTTPLAYDTNDDIMKISIANRFIPSGNAELEGTDAESSSPVTLRGNFGVTYRIRVSLTSSDGRVVALLLNPRGGAYGGYFRTTFPEGLTANGLLVPSGSNTVNENTQGGVIGIFEPTASPQTLLIETIPAGASSLPIDLLLVPFSPPAGPAGLTMLGENDL